MIKASTEKDEEIKAMIASMRDSQLTTLGMMGMARTIPLVMQIAKHTDFNGISQFDKIIKIGIQKALYDYTDIDDSLNICNSLIPYLEMYDFSDCIDKHDEDLMSVAYYLVEEWYYFIGLIAGNIQSEEYKKLG